ncbi:hypothetical protein [Bacillus sp. REN3]|uniref:hypothetical protein n=1 Tax=Bacillus sp. REN3 TaxID=2802440 RepID=UPI001AEE777E|nr:hypothetical protein [Bacillus sp. REN3]
MGGGKGRTGTIVPKRRALIKIREILKRYSRNKRPTDEKRQLSYLEEAIHTALHGLPKKELTETDGTGRIPS